MDIRSRAILRLKHSLDEHRRQSQEVFSALSQEAALSVPQSDISQDPCHEQDMALQAWIVDVQNLQTQLQDKIDEGPDKIAALAQCRLDHPEYDPEQSP